MATTQSPFAEIFPRLYELKAAVPDPSHPDAYFQNFEERLEQSQHVRYQYMKFERPFRVLAAEAWCDLKERAAPLTMRRDPKRGWQTHPERGPGIRPPTQHRLHGYRVRPTRQQEDA